MDSSQLKIEWIKCHRDVCYFTETYVQIFNAHSKAGASGAATGAWIPFQLWPAQRQVLRDFVVHPYTIVLKARQLGMSWLTLSYALWLMLFHPAANIMLMSKRDDESIELLANRLIEMHARLPESLQAKRVLQESAHDFVLSNGSRAKAFPTSGGRSYTGTLVLLDEADFLPDLTKVLNAIKPAIDAGGHLILLSTVDKERPLSTFKELFRDAWYQKGTNYYPIFLPWSARPGRTPAWYDQITIDMRKQSGGTDDSLWQEYPATPEQALAPLQLDKRIPFAWLQQCRGSRTPLDLPDRPPVPDLTIYVAPVLSIRAPAAPQNDADRLPSAAHWPVQSIAPYGWTRNSTGASSAKRCLRRWTIASTCCGQSYNTPGSMSAPFGQTIVPRSSSTLARLNKCRSAPLRQRGGLTNSRSDKARLASKLVLGQSKGIDCANSQQTHGVISLATGHIFRKCPPIVDANVKTTNCPNESGVTEPVPWRMHRSWSMVGFVNMARMQFANNTNPDYTNCDLYNPN